MTRYAAVKDGEMTEAKANAWDQDWAVARVRDIARKMGPNETSYTA